LSSFPNDRQTCPKIREPESILETFKYAFTGVGEFNWFYLSYSFSFTCLIVLVGIIIFNKVQRNFMDVI